MPAKRTSTLDVFTPARIEKPWCRCAARVRPQAAREEEAAGRRSMKGRDAFEELKRMAAATVSATPPGLRGSLPGGGGEASTSGSGAAPAQNPAPALCGRRCWLARRQQRAGQAHGLTAWQARDMARRAGPAAGGAAAERALLDVTGPSLCDTGVTPDLGGCGTCQAASRHLHDTGLLKRLTYHAASIHRAHRGVVSPQTLRARRYTTATRDPLRATTGCCAAQTARARRCTPTTRARTWSG